MQSNRELPTEQKWPQQCKNLSKKMESGEKNGQIALPCLCDQWNL